MTTIDTSNYVHLCITRNYWGANKEKRLAIRNCRSCGGGTAMKNVGYRIYMVHPNFEVCEVTGNVQTPIGHKAILVEDKAIK